MINHLPGELEDCKRSKGPAFLLSFGASRANIPAAPITGPGDNTEGESNNFMEIRSRCHRLEAHLGIQGIDRRGETTLGPFSRGFTARFEEADFWSYS